MTITITRELADQLLDEIVAEYGADYVYPGAAKRRCRYVHNSEPDCLIAKMLARAGADVNDLLRCEDLRPSSEAWPMDRISFEDDKLKNYLGEIQVSQDRGNPWGECVTEARAKFPVDLTPVSV